MTSLIEIARGWKNMIVNDDSTQELVKERLTACETCEYKGQLTPAGQKVLKAINEKNSLYYCGVCGCPLATLLTIPERECKHPDGPRWHSAGKKG